MPEQCPTSGFTCVNEVIARILVLSDQLSGTGEAVLSGLVPPDGKVLAVHLKKTAMALQETATQYADVHGAPPLQDMVEASMWLLGEMRG